MEKELKIIRDTKEKLEKQTAEVKESVKKQQDLLNDIQRELAGVKKSSKGIFAWL